MSVKTISMVRDTPVHPGGPVMADVHPDEVANWQAHGWRVAKPSAAENENPPPAAPGTVDPAATPGDTAEPAAPAGGSRKKKTS